MLVGSSDELLRLLPADLFLSKESVKKLEIPLSYRQPAGDVTKKCANAHTSLCSSFGKQKRMFWCIFIVFFCECPHYRPNCRKYRVRIVGMPLRRRFFAQKPALRKKSRFQVKSVPILKACVLSITYSWLYFTVCNKLKYEERDRRTEKWGESRHYSCSKRVIFQPILMSCKLTLECKRKLGWICRCGVYCHCQ